MKLRNKTLYNNHGVYVAASSLQNVFQCLCLKTLSSGAYQQHEQYIEKDSNIQTTKLNDTIEM